MIEFLFLDLDDTILDFHQAERNAIPKVLRHFGIEPTEELIHRYHVINLEHWQRLERGEITRAQISNRFDVLFAEVGKKADTPECERLYRHYLGMGHYFMPGAEESVKSLHRKYRLFLASNGTASVQASRMNSAGLYPYFEQCFVSEELGVNKPDKAFFDRAFARIPDFDPAKAMMVGDSLTSDILGGINAGIRTCWVNPGHAPEKNGIHPDFQIEGLYQLEDLLETL